MLNAKAWDILSIIWTNTIRGMLERKVIVNVSGR